MYGTYKTLFILPLGAEKFLTEDGWEFISQDRLGEVVKRKLIEGLCLSYVHEYESIEKYAGEDLEVLFFYDDNKCIESIMMKLYGGAGKMVIEFLKNTLASSSEIFFPNL